MPFDHSSTARDWARPRTANFALLNATAPPRPRTEEVAPVKIIAPTCCLSMSGRASRAHRNAPKTAVRQERSNSSGDVFSKCPPSEPLACAMRISTGPSFSRTLRNPAATCFASEMSVGTASSSGPSSAASLPINAGERANMPTRQPSCASLVTSEAPSPGPTPATIATRLRDLLIILSGVLTRDEVQAWPSVMAQLLGELFPWLRLTLGLFTAWQTPLSLFTKRQREELSESEFVLLAICSNTDTNGVLRHVEAQSAMKFVPPAKNCSPVRVRLLLNCGVMS